MCVLFLDPGDFVVGFSRGSEARAALLEQIGWSVPCALNRWAVGVIGIALSHNVVFLES